MLSVNSVNNEIFAQISQDPGFSANTTSSEDLEGIVSIEQAKVYLSAATDSLKFKDTSTANFYIEKAINSLNDLKEKLGTQ